MNFPALPTLEFSNYLVRMEFFGGFGWDLRHFTSFCLTHVTCYLGVSKNRGTLNLDGLWWKTLFFNGWFGGYKPIFGNTHLIYITTVFVTGKWHSRKSQLWQEWAIHDCKSLNGVTVNGETVGEDGRTKPKAESNFHRHKKQKQQLTHCLFKLKRAPDIWCILPEMNVMT